MPPFGGDSAVISLHIPSCSSACDRYPINRLARGTAEIGSPALGR